MDANLELDPTPDGHCRLTLTGNYTQNPAREGPTSSEVRPFPR